MKRMFVMKWFSLLSQILWKYNNMGNWSNIWGNVTVFPANQHSVEIMLQTAASADPAMPVCECHCVTMFPANQHIVEIMLLTAASVNPPLSICECRCWKSCSTSSVW